LPGISRFPDKMWQGHITRDSQESSSLTRYLWYFVFQLEVYSIQLYVIKFVKDLRQIGRFLWVLWFPPVKLPRYNWNIVESGIKHLHWTKTFSYVNIVTFFVTKLGAVVAVILW
jgi:hypothetical protein